MPVLAGCTAPGFVIPSLSGGGSRGRIAAREGSRGAAGAKVRRRSPAFPLAARVHPRVRGWNHGECQKRPMDFCLSFWWRKMFPDPGGRHRGLRYAPNWDPHQGSTFRTSRSTCENSRIASDATRDGGNGPRHPHATITWPMEGGRAARFPDRASGSGGAGAMLGACCAASPATVTGHGGRRVEKNKARPVLRDRLADLAETLTFGPAPGLGPGV